MIKLIFFSITLLLPGLSLADPDCQYEGTIEISSETKTLEKVNCEAINKLNKCKERKIDPDGLKKAILKMMATAEEMEEGIKRRWDRYKGTRMGSLYTEKREGSRVVPISIFDWFTNNYPEVDKEKLKSTFAESYANFAKKHDCSPKVKTEYKSKSCPTNYNKRVEGRNATEKARNLTRMKKEYAAYIRSDEFKEESQKCLDPYQGQEGADKLILCGNKVKERPSTIVGKIYSPCAGNITGFYADNSWALKNIEQLLSSESSSELISCIKDRLARGAKIHHVSISSSANALNNTGDAAKQFCKKGFLGLSKARADNAREELLPKLLNKAGVSNKGGELDEMVKVKPNGRNGDGTSGPCPYEYGKDGKEKLKPEFAKGGTRRSELEDGKFVKLQVTFKDLRQKVNQQYQVFRPLHTCRKISFECR